VNSTIQRLAGEFVVIVVGVLVALGVDQWRERQGERELEAAYATRLIGDLRADTAAFGDMLRGVWVDKRVFLLALSEGRVPQTESADELMVLLDHSVWLGIISVQAAAFREMESSGRLRLLANSATRDALANYYAHHAFLAGLFATSPSGFRLLVYEAIPGPVRYAYHTGQAIDGGQVMIGTAALLDDPRLPAAVNAEVAYFAELVQRYEVLRDDAAALIQQLEVDYPAEGSF
jgi:hypothetical protein